MDKNTNMARVSRVLRKNSTAKSGSLGASRVWFRRFWTVDRYHSFNEAETGSRFRITADVFAFSGSDGAVARAAAESASW